MTELSGIIQLWFEWQIRAIFISLIVLLAAASFNWRSPLWRHWVLIVGSCLLVVSPLIYLVLPKFEWSILPRVIELAPFAPSIQLEERFDITTGSSPTFNWSHALFWLGFSLSIYFFLRHFFAWRAQKKIELQALEPDVELARLFEDCVVKVGVKGLDPILKVAREEITPCTYGWASPVVLIPSDAAAYDQDRLRIILMHELYHIKRRDWLWQQICCFAVFVNPLNPLIWHIRYLSISLAEESVDKSVLSQDVQPMAYAETLIQQVRIERGFFASIAVRMHKQRDIVGRVESLISEPYSWPNLGRAERCGLGVMVLLLVLPALIINVQYSPYERLNIPRFSVADVLLSEQQVSEKKETGKTEQDLISKTYPPILKLEAPLLEPEREKNVGIVVANSLTSLHPVDLSPAIISEKLRLSIPVKPKPIFLASPSYPSVALSRGWEARVEVVFDIDDSGQVINPRVLNPGDRRSRLFEAVAIKAISESRYDLRPVNDETFIQRDMIQTYTFQIVDEDQQVFLKEDSEKPP